MRAIRKANARLVPLSPRHAGIVPHLRRADVEEIWAMSGVSPRLAVAYTIALSDPGWAVELDGDPLAIFGAGRVSGTLGRPWLVGTDALERYPVHFFRVSKGIIDELLARYERLENWTDARNTLSLRWLKWAGFHIEPAEPWGAEGRLFHRFWV